MITTKEGHIMTKISKFFNTLRLSLNQTIYDKKIAYYKPFHCQQSSNTVATNYLNDSSATNAMIQKVESIESRIRWKMSLNEALSQKAHTLALLILCGYEENEIKKDIKEYIKMVRDLKCISKFIGDELNIVKEKYGNLSTENSVHIPPELGVSLEKIDALHEKSNHNINGNLMCVDKYLDKLNKKRIADVCQLKNIKSG
jgi:archaellum component FlaC